MNRSPTNRMAELRGQRLAEHVRKEPRQERQSMPCGPSRSCSARLHRRAGEPAVAGRHHRTPQGEGKLDRCASRDAYSNRTVGHSIDSQMKSTLATTALRSAGTRRGEMAGYKLHTDRRSQFRSRTFVHALGR